MHHKEKNIKDSIRVMVLDQGNIAEFDSPDKNAGIAGTMRAQVVIVVTECLGLPNL